VLKYCVSLFNAIFISTTDFISVTVSIIVKGMSSIFFGFKTFTPFDYLYEYAILVNSYLTNSRTNSFLYTSNYFNNTNLNLQTKYGNEEISSHSRY
jgi:hypothetical protein